MKWFPAKIIWRRALEIAQRAAQAISGASRVPHRGTTGPPGGSLPGLIRSPGFVVKRRWGAVTKWSEGGGALLFWKKGTTKQEPRDFETMPERVPLEAEIRADALRHFERRESRYGGRA